MADGYLCSYFAPRPAGALRLARGFMSLLLVLGLGSCSPIALEAETDRPDQATPDETVTLAGTTDDNLVLASEIILESPEISFEASPAFCCSPLAMDFVAGVSDIALDDIVAFEWDFGDGRTESGRMVKHTYPWAGEYLVRLYADTRDDATLMVERQVTVGAPNPPTNLLEPTLAPFVLVANAGQDQSVSAGEQVTLDGSGSVYGSTDGLEFSWVQLSGPTIQLTDANQPIAHFQASSPVDGSVVIMVELTVRLSGIEAVDRVSIVVLPEPTSPTDQISNGAAARAGSDQTVQGGVQVVLDGAASTTGNPGGLVFNWIQRSGPAVVLSAPQEARTTFVAPVIDGQAVALRFELTVTDGLTSGSDEVVVMVMPSAPAPGVPDDARILSWMQELPALQKVHYSWPLSSALLNDEAKSPLLQEYIRLANAACVWGEWVTHTQLDKVLAMCQQVNAGEPAIPASIGILIRPWSRVFPPDVPPMYDGPEVAEELALIDQRLTMIRDWIEEYNSLNQSTITVTAVILECERFVIKPAEAEGHEEWNTAIDMKHDAAHLAVKMVFPDTRVERYARAISPLFTLRELGETFSVAMYHTPEPDVMQRLLERAHEVARAHQSDKVTPWLALGSSYAIDPDGAKVWRFDNDYDPDYSWQLGARINDPFYETDPDVSEPWLATQAVVFWPAPWDERVASWPMHFIAYVRGAHGIN